MFVFCWHPVELDVVQYVGMGFVPGGCGLALLRDYFRPSPLRGAS